MSDPTTIPDRQSVEERRRARDDGPRYEPADADREVVELGLPPYEGAMWPAP